MIRKVAFRITEADYVTAILDSWRRNLLKPRLLAVRAITVLVIASGAGVLLGIHDNVLGPFGALYWLLPLGVGATVFSLALNYFVFVPRHSRRLFGQQVAIQRPGGARWSDEEFTQILGNDSTTMAWGEFYCWHDTKDTILLFLNEGSMWLLPRHYFTAEQINDLIDLLRRRGPARR